jgi:hypothetical protein
MCQLLLEKVVCDRLLPLLGRRDGSSRLMAFVRSLNRIVYVLSTINAQEGVLPQCKSIDVLLHHHRLLRVELGHSAPPACH